MDGTPGLHPLGAPPGAPRPGQGADRHQGLDEVTDGGLPRGRTTLVVGAAGAGKTLFGIEYLVRGARDLGEPGVLMSFEESRGELAENVASLGFDLDQLERDGLLVVDAVHLDRSEFVETGAFDLEGIFLRLGAAVDQVGAKRVTLDTIEVLFAALEQRGDHPRRAGTPLPVAQGPRPHRCRDRGAGSRRADDPLRDRGVRLGLRDRARPPRRPGGLHAPAAGGEVPRLAARHQRVPVPDHGGRPGRRPDHVRRPRRTTHPRSGSRRASTQLDEMLGGGVYRGLDPAGRRRRRNRQDQRGGARRSTRRAAGRARAVLLAGGVARPAHPQHGRRSASTSSAGWTRGCSRSPRCARRASGLEEHLASLRSALDETRRAWWSSTRSRAWPASAARTRSRR